MTKQEYKDAIRSIVVSEEKKKEIWGRIELVNLQMEDGNPEANFEEKKEDTQKASKQGKLLHFQKNQKRWQVVLAACLTLALILPAGAYAAGKIKEWYDARFDESGMTSQIELKKETKVAQEDREIIQYAGTNEEKLQNNISWAGVTTFVKVDYDEKDLEPDYSLRTAEMDDVDPIDFYGRHYFRYQNDESKGKDFMVELYYVTDSVSIQENNREGMEKLTVDGHEAYYSKELSSGSQIREYGERFPISLYVFYPEYGYYLLYSAAENMQKEDLTGLADKITLKQVEREQTDEFWLAEDFEEEYYEEDLRVYGNFHKKTEAAIVDGVEYLVTKVEVRDSIEGLKKSDMEGGYQKNCTKNGTLKKYTREQYETGDGITAPRENVVKTEQIQPKLLYLTIQAKNTTKQKKSTFFLGMNLRSLVKKGKKEYYRLENNYIRDEKGMAIGTVSGEPFYFEGAKKQDGTRYLEFPANSTTTFHIGFLADEDQIENSYINIHDGIYVDEKTDHCIEGEFIPLFE